jgi:hypothetical protein
LNGCNFDRCAAGDVNKGDKTAAPILALMNAQGNARTEPKWFGFD